MHWQIHKDGRMDYLATDGRLEVAVALGLDPVTRVLGVGAAAEAHRRVHARRLPHAASRSSSCKAKTIDLEVPANAEIVLEGYVEQGDLALEGPFGDHTGYYTAAGAVPGLPRDRDDDARATRSTRRSSSASRRPRTRGSARRPSGSSCRRSG